jgi:hypothetical protein
LSSLVVAGVVQMMQAVVVQADSELAQHLALLLEQTIPSPLVPLGLAA